MNLVIVWEEIFEYALQSEFIYGKGKIEFHCCPSNPPSSNGTLRLAEWFFDNKCKSFVMGEEKLIAKQLSEWREKLKALSLKNDRVKWFKKHFVQLYKFLKCF